MHPQRTENVSFRAYRIQVVNQFLNNNIFFELPEKFIQKIQIRVEYIYS